MLSIVTFANLGKKENLKTPDILPVISAAQQAGVLQQLLCQIDSGYPFARTVMLYPRLARYVAAVYERCTGRAVSRSRIEAYIDARAARTLQPTEVVLVHPALFPRTIAQAHTQGAVVVGIAAAAHPRYAERLFHEECALLGIPHLTYAEAAEEKDVYDSLDHVIAMSDFVRDTLIKEGYPQERIDVVPPDVDTSRFMYSTRPNDRFRVVYAGYTTPLKGLHYLLDAWERLRLPDAELVIVGGYGDMPSDLAARFTARISQNPSITMIGSTQRPEEWYRQASVFVFPSLSEGFGRVTLEAMACGVPVITTEHARGIVEEGKTGFIVPIRSSAAIAEKLQFLYDHPETVKVMGAAAREAVIAKPSSGRAILNIYQRIMQAQEKGATLSI
jgi:glycosyltransferase involved in cell wall biosynthesis